MLEVVLMSLCPSHSWICFMGTPFLSRRDAQLWRRSCRRMCRRPLFRRSFPKLLET